MAKGKDEQISPARQDDVTAGEEETLRGMDDLSATSDEDEDDFDLEDLDDEEEEEDEGGGSF
jgi:hypothetical protein